ncbi:MAG: response regulator [Deltaproteobacteria bacterium]|nr:response regulator [Deltaproteobacteria bacterium]MBW1951626.1 response regulator [Deltaproteobacteria bacterium]MBW1986643.1 response regulator [Deltaproteobacteria bacterium]MBW2134756.1 response regulator [Deltaproteobacteria bacterium]
MFGGQVKSKRERILVVDQDGTTREFLANIIKLLGCDFELVESVEEALKALENHVFDLLITDLHLPESRKLFENTVQQSPHLRTICMVRHRQLMIDTYHLTDTVFVLKPFNFDDMINTIRRAIHDKNLLEVEAEFRRLRRQAFRILS